jgi:hypothetical protein
MFITTRPIVEITQATACIGETSYTDVSGTTTISLPARTLHRTARDLVAIGFRLEGTTWIREAIKTETYVVTEIYRGATIQIIEWVAPRNLFTSELR